MNMMRNHQVWGFPSFRQSQLLSKPRDFSPLWGLQDGTVKLWCVAAQSKNAGPPEVHGLKHGKSRNQLDGLMGKLWQYET